MSGQVRTTGREDTEGCTHELDSPAEHDNLWVLVVRQRIPLMISAVSTIDMPWFSLPPGTS